MISEKIIYSAIENSKTVQGQAPADSVLYSRCAPPAQRSNSGGCVYMHLRSMLPAVHPASSHSCYVHSERHERREDQGLPVEERQDGRRVGGSFHPVPEILATYLSNHSEHL